MIKSPWSHQRIVRITVLKATEVYIEVTRLKAWIFETRTMFPASDSMRADHYKNCPRRWWLCSRLLVAFPHIGICPFCRLGLRISSETDS